MVTIDRKKSYAYYRLVSLLIQLNDRIVGNIKGLLNSQYWPERTKHRVNWSRRVNVDHVTVIAETICQWRRRLSKCTKAMLDILSIVSDSNIVLTNIFIQNNDR